MKILICGGRDFSDYALLKKVIDKEITLHQFNYPNDKIEIVSGGARGADYLAEKYAKEKKYDLKVFPAQWDKFGKSAGYRRNDEMAQYLDKSDNRWSCIIVAFWDSLSRGTKSMIALAERFDLDCKIVYYNIK
jgi:hypothetical protein